MKRPEFEFFKPFADIATPCTKHAGSWALAPITAISLYPKKNSLLTIKQGRVWATVNTGAQNRANGYGDHFLDAGDSLLVHKGEHLVFEPSKKSLPVFFDFTAI